MGGPGGEQHARVLFDVSDALANAALDLDRVLEIAAESTASELGCTAIVRFFDKDTGLFRLAAIAGDPEGAVAAVCERLPQFPTNGHQPGPQPPQPMVVPEISTEIAAGAPHLAELRAAGVRGLIVMPLVAHDELQGTLAVACPTPFGSDLEATRLFVREMANRVALAVDNARLYAAVQSEAEHRRCAERDLEVALGESTARFLRLAEAVPDVVFRLQLSPEPRALYVSPASVAISGYTLEDYQDNPALLVESVHPDDRGLLDAWIRNPPEDGLPVTVGPIRWLHKDGHIVYVEHNVTFTVRHGTAVAVEGVTRDVTERVRAKQAVEAVLDVSDALAGAALDFDSVLEIAVRRVADLLGSSSYVCLVDDEYEALRLATVSCEAAGLRAALADAFDGLSLGIEEIATLMRTGEALVVADIAPAAAGSLPIPWNRLYDAGGRGYALVPLRMGGTVIGFIGAVRQAGEASYVAAHADFLREIADRVAEAAENARLHRRLQQEVAERKRVQWSLANANARLEKEVLRRRDAQKELQSLTRGLETRVEERSAENVRLVATIAASDDAIFRIAEDGTIATWNSGAEKLYGYTGEEAIGRPKEMLVSDAALGEVKDITRRVLAGERVRFEQEHRRKDGSKVWVSAAVSLQQDDAGQVTDVSVIIRDISEGKRIEAERAEAARRAEALDRLSGALARKTADYPELLRVAARGMAESIGDASLIGVIATDGHTLEVVFDHADPQVRVEMARLAASMVVRCDEEPYRSVIETGEPRLIPVVRQEGLQDRIRPEFRTYAEKVGLHSLLMVPMRARGETLGVASVTRDRPGRPYGEADRRFLEDIATRVALAIANARLLRRTQEELGRRAAAERELSEANRELRRIVLHDPLTELPNRALCRERLDHVIGAARSTDSPAAALFLDLDRFKVINDSAGHAAGDAVLAEAARRFESTVPEADTVACFGGDEFVFLVEGVGEEAAATVAARLLGCLEEPFVIGTQAAVVTASIGIVVFRGGDEQPDDLLRQADVALRRAKELGGGRWMIFDDSMRPFIGERFEIENELRDAIRSRRLLLEYQPLFDVATGHVTAVEALTTWAHPVRGLLRAGEFIPLAEESGLIIELGEFVLRSACEQLSAWRGSYPEARPAMHVNVSARQLPQRGLVDMVAGVLQETLIPPGRLCLELTETALMMEPDAALAELRALKRLGVHLALDDFGVEYSPLTYLKRFPMDVLKVDKVFVAGLATDAGDVAIVRTIVTLAHSLGLQVVAEGVETDAQFQRLIALECDLVQGYHLARPGRAEGIGPLLSTAPAADVW